MRDDIRMHLFSKLLFQDLGTDGSVLNPRVERGPGSTPKSHKTKAPPRPKSETNPFPLLRLRLEPQKGLQKGLRLRAEV